MTGPTVEQLAALVRREIGVARYNPDGARYLGADEALAALSVLQARVEAAERERDEAVENSRIERVQAMHAEADAERLKDALLNAQGCRTCDMCPDCGHLAHGPAEAIGHYEGCALADALSGTPNAPTDGLSPDLVRVLRDPTITIARDHEIRLADGRTLFEHLETWRNAPSNTASAALADTPKEGTP